MHIYKCKHNCHIRVYPFWVGDEGEKCPRCGEWLLYKGEKTEEQMNQMVKDCSKNLVRSKKQLKKRKKK
jgi:transcription initiation factor IIE alpha subunit